MSNLSGSDSWAVQIWVYDLSRGMAAQLSLPLLGRRIDGIWHTSVVVYGKEFFYGQGVSTTTPGASHHGQPLEKIDVGRTQIDPDTWQDVLSDLKERYTADRYHLLDYNCNTFSKEVVELLCPDGPGMPSHISDLPADFLSTPFGAMMRPQIDSMFAGAGSNRAPSHIPANGSAATSIVDQVAQRAFSGNSTAQPPTRNGAPNGSAGTAGVDHAHDNCTLSYPSRFSRAWKEGARWDAKLSYGKVWARVDASITAIPTTSSTIQAKADLQRAGKSLKSSVIQHLDAGKRLDTDQLGVLQECMTIFALHLPLAQIFPALELCRQLSFFYPSSKTWTTSDGRKLQFGAKVEALLSGPYAGEDAVPAARASKIAQSTFRMIANGLQSTSREEVSLASLAGQIGSLLNHGLLHADPDVQASAASAAWNWTLVDAASRESSSRQTLISPDAAVELAAALYEAIGRDGQALRLSLKALLRLVYKNPSWDEQLRDLLQVLQLSETLDGVSNRLEGSAFTAEDREEVPVLVSDLRLLLELSLS